MKNQPYAPMELVEAWQQRAARYRADAMGQRGDLDRARMEAMALMLERVSKELSHAVLGELLRRDQDLPFHPIHQGGKGPGDAFAQELAPHISPKSGVGACAEEFASGPSKPGQGGNMRRATGPVNDLPAHEVSVEQVGGLVGIRYLIDLQNLPSGQCLQLRQEGTDTLHISFHTASPSTGTHENQPQSEESK